MCPYMFDGFSHNGHVSVQRCSRFPPKTEKFHLYEFILKKEQSKFCVNCFQKQSSELNMKKQFFQVLQNSQENAFLFFYFLKETPTQVLSWEFCQILRTYFYKAPPDE